MTVILRILVAILFLAAPRAASESVAAAGEQDAVQVQPGAPLETPRVVRKPPGGAPQDASAVTFEGTLSWVSPSYGDRYLALPQPRGTRAEICGPADCVTRLSTDYGPDQRANPDRIADLSAADWQRVCGLELRFGLCPGTVTLAGLPATDKP